MEGVNEWRQIHWCTYLQESVPPSSACRGDETPWSCHTYTPSHLCEWHSLGAGCCFLHPALDVCTQTLASIASTTLNEGKPTIHSWWKGRLVERMFHYEGKLPLIWEILNIMCHGSSVGPWASCTEADAWHVCEASSSPLQWPVVNKKYTNDTRAVGYYLGHNW